MIRIIILSGMLLSSSVAARPRWLELPGGHNLWLNKDTLAKIGELTTFEYSYYGKVKQGAVDCKKWTFDEEVIAPGYPEDLLAVEVCK